MNIEVNYLAVVLAGVASMVVGFLWYSPMLFGKKCAKLMGFSEEHMKKTQKEMGKFYALSFVLSLVTAYVLFHVMTMSIYYYNNPAVMTGLMTAFFSWFGFIMPVQATGVIFSKDHSRDQWIVFAINTGYQLAALLVMGVVMGFMM